LRDKSIPVGGPLSGGYSNTARAATSAEVKDLRREARDLKEVVAEQALELRLLKKSMIGDGGDDE
jgi:transposase